MTIQLDLQADVERGLLAQAERHGMSLAEYVQQIIAREAHRPPCASQPQAANLADLSESVRGLLSDEEVDRIFRRNPSIGRPVDLA
ncbi:MAG TPA: hypothetical protein VF283_20790 [Bryobacteraceae bacterium]